MRLLDQTYRTDVIFAHVCTRDLKQPLGISGGGDSRIRYFGCIASCILIGFERPSLALTASPLRNRDLEKYVVRANIVREYGIAHPVSGVQI